MTRLSLRFSRTLQVAVVAAGIASAAAALGVPAPVPDDRIGAPGAPRLLTLVADSILFWSPIDGDKGSLARLRQGAIRQVAYSCGDSPGYSFTVRPLPGSVAVYLAYCIDEASSYLWRLDLLDDVVSPVPAEGSSGPIFGENSERVGGRYYFRSEGRFLRSSDGTPEGTATVQEFAGLDTPLVSMGEIGLFTANDSSIIRPWVTDGTAEGTRELAEVAPAQIHTEEIDHYHAFGGRALFLGWTSDDGLELWSTDGSPEGTGRVSNLRPGDENPLVEHMVPCRRRAFFRSRGLGPGSTEVGYELWTSDGSEPGTHLVADLVPGIESSWAMPIGCLGSRAVFVAGDAAGVGYLGLSDGTSPGTIQIRPLIDLQIPTGPSWEYRGRLFFAASTPETGMELWVTDGTDAGTHRIADLRPGPDGSYPENLVALGDSVYFVASDREGAARIWRLVVEPGLLLADGFESADPRAWAEPCARLPIEEGRGDAWSCDPSPRNQRD